jgi:hypothetical protein
MDVSRHAEPGRAQSPAADDAIAVAADEKKETKLRAQ